MAKVDVSVIICCYNSARRINETLRYLHAQQATMSWEIILVDNASTDNTAEIARTLWLAKPPLVIINEVQPGLSHARAAGVKAAAAPIIIFCDDDNWLDANYVQNAYDLMKTFPEAGIIGGWCDGAFETPLAPNLGAMQGALSIGKQSNHDGETSTVYGAGMVIRKECFETISGAGPSLLDDRKGKILSSGGDTELCLRVLFAGYKVRFSESLHFIHFMPKERLQKSYFFRLCVRNVGDRITLAAYEAIRKDANSGFAHFFFGYIFRMLQLVLYSLPRMVWGRHQFHSTISFFAGSKLAGLIILRWRHYSGQFQRIHEIRSELETENYNAFH